MNYEIKDDKLTISLEDGELLELSELVLEDGDNDDTMNEWFEDMIANSELEWIDPNDTGDLTDAPMLGITGDDQISKEGPYGSFEVGYWEDKAWYRPILQRFAYMDYQVISVLSQLLLNKTVTFSS